MKSFAILFVLVGSILILFSINTLNFAIIFVFKTVQDCFFGFKNKDDIKGYKTTL